MEQKFKRGNKVKVLVGHNIYRKVKGDLWEVVDMAPEQIGQEAAIIGSYFDLFGGSQEENKNTYQIIFLETGNTVAWKELRELEFIDEGGEHLIEAANLKYQQNQDKVKT